MVNVQTLQMKRPDAICFYILKRLHQQANTMRHDLNEPIKVFLVFLVSLHKGVNKLLLVTDLFATIIKPYTSLFQAI